MKNFLKILKENFEIVIIEDEISSEYEAARILKKYPKSVVILKNIKNSNMPIISGICNTREKIANALNTTVPQITNTIIDGMNNPKKIENKSFVSEKYNSSAANLSKLPILTHYKNDGGAYITAGVIIAQDPETGIRNASIHRMMVIDDNHLAVRLVPRHLYTYHQKAESMNKDLNISIVIGINPACLLASTTSIPINVDELEVANSFLGGKLNLIKCNNGLNVPEAEIILEGKILNKKRTHEGPFVDLTDTYDVVRDEPIIELDTMHIKEDAYYHAIYPAGFEHKLLQGLPQEPRIFNAVQNTAPGVENVVLTEGGCCWLHAAISINKQTQGDAKNVILSALSAHPSLKHVIVVDTDINIFDSEELEYAIATRVKGDEDIIIIPGARGSSLDPSALPDGTTTKIGIDATKILTKKDKFKRISLYE